MIWLHRLVNRRFLRGQGPQVTSVSAPITNVHTFHRTLAFAKGKTEVERVDRQRKWDTNGPEISGDYRQV
ncbi:MAG: hypothetical protein O3A33_12710, partial [Chloroflexi bacterium]|nr:hypothetical protein [Chloroflexota bacterium]